MYSSTLQTTRAIPNGATGEIGYAVRRLGGASVCLIHNPNAMLEYQLLLPRPATGFSGRVFHRFSQTRAPEESGSTTQEQSWSRRRATVV